MNTWPATPEPPPTKTSSSPSPFDVADGKRRTVPRQHVRQERLDAVIQERARAVLVRQSAAGVIGSKTRALRRRRCEAAVALLLWRPAA